MTQGSNHGSFIRQSIWTALIIFLLAGGFSMALAIYLGGSPRSAEPSFLPLHFQGGVVVYFRESVSDARIKEIISSVGGSIASGDARTQMVVLKFTPTINLDQAESIGKQLERMPEVKSAGPQYTSLGT